MPFKHTSEGWECLSCGRVYCDKQAPTECSDDCPSYWEEQLHALEKGEAMSFEPTYRIIRFYMHGHPNRIIKEGLTLEEAEEHCKDPETSSVTCSEEENILHTKESGPWFDGFQEE